MNNFDVGVYIGRFQPFHLGHKFVVEAALQQCNNLIIVIGSAKTWRTESNPFSYEERVEIIRNSLTDAQNEKVIIVGVKDYYNNTLWNKAVETEVNAHLCDEDVVGLFGHVKDESSYYLEHFPMWNFVDVVNHQMISATDIRNMYFSEDVSFALLNTLTCANTVSFLKAFKQISAYQEICKEIEANRKYKALWKDSPFPVQFITADSVVECNGKILLIERGGYPGKGKLALPGGFVDANERVFDAAVRELFEETQLDIAKNVLRESVKGSAVFDHPKRSSRGRTITHSFHFKLPFSHINAKAHDDAKAVMWVEISQLKDLEDRFFEDHFLIIDNYLKINQ